MPELIIGKNFPERVAELIEQTKRTIDIIVFDWRWYPSDPSNPVQRFNQALVRAAKRGVYVRALANSDELVRTLHGCGINAKRPTVKNLVHVKCMVLDGQTIVLGSHNYTQYAFTMNYEVSVVFDDPLAAASLREFFEGLYL